MQTSGSLSFYWTLSATALLPSDKHFQSSRWNHVVILYVYIQTYSDLIYFTARFDQFDPVWQNAWWIEKKGKEIHEMRVTLY